MSKDDFHKHWREVHGPLVVNKLGKYLQGYEQRHRLASDDWHDDEFGGIPIQRYASKEAVDAFMGDPAVAESVGPDPDALRAMSKVIWFLAEPAERFVDPAGYHARNRRHPGGR